MFVYSFLQYFNFEHRYLRLNHNILYYLPITRKLDCLQFIFDLYGNIKYSVSHTAGAAA